jgi:hypothetical protein
MLKFWLCFYLEFETWTLIWISNWNRKHNKKTEKEKTYPTCAVGRNSFLSPAPTSTLQPVWPTIGQTLRYIYPLRVHGFTGTGITLSYPWKKTIELRIKPTPVFVGINSPKSASYMFFTHGHSDKMCLLSSLNTFM